MSIVSQFSKLPLPAKIATSVAGGAAVIGGSAFLASCASPKNSSDVVREEFNRFDRDGQDGVGMHEAELVGQRTYTTTSDQRFFNSDYVTRTYSTRQQTWTDTAARGVGAADERGNKDAVASWQELTNLAMSYDVDGDSMLGRKERDSFDRDYGVRRIDHGTRILDESTRLVHDPLPRYEEPAPYNPPRYEPPTSGGDSGGDSGYDYGSGSGNSSGDSGDYVPSPGSGSSGDSGGSSSSGDSTSNGNAEW